MLPFASTGSKVTPRHHASSSVSYSNGSAKPASTLEFSPHRFQPRNSPPSLRRRRKLLTRLTIVGLIVMFAIFIWPGAPVASIFSLGLFGRRIQLETVRYYDLSNVQGTARGWEREERILLCVPLRDAEAHLPMFFSHLRNFTYPHHLIDLAFLVSDSKDRTLDMLIKNLEEIQGDEDSAEHFGEISILEKDFGQKVNQDVESRHGFAAQASRRKLMAQARNWLLSASLRPFHSWVYWRDVDVETAPFTILEDLMRHNKDVIVPNVWRPLPDWLGGEQPYDLNSWQESETALALADTLDEDAVIVEGYAEYATWRPHLAYLRDPYGDPDMEMEIDGVGGVSILSKATVFRHGVHFPAFSFEKHAETEGFGKMARRMGFSVVGLPHYTIWHLYEPSLDDIRHMEEMEHERVAREQEEREKAEAAEKMKETFDDTGDQWEKDKAAMENGGENVNHDEHRDENHEEHQEEHHENHDEHHEEHHEEHHDEHHDDRHEEDRHEAERHDEKHEGSHEEAAPPAPQAPPAQAPPGWAPAQQQAPPGQAPAGWAPAQQQAPPAQAPGGWAPAQQQAPPAQAPGGWVPAQQQAPPAQAPAGWAPAQQAPPAQAPAGWVPAQQQAPPAQAPPGWVPAQQQAPPGQAPAGWAPAQQQAPPAQAPAGWPAQAPPAQAPPAQAYPGAPQVWA